MNLLWPLAKPLLHALDAERAHDLTLRALATAPLPAPKPDDSRLHVEAFGLRFTNPIGLAAGFDKNGVIAHRVGRLGFGSIEIGTITPQPQSGNDRPRLFRLPKEGGVINRFGFNNIGHDGVIAKMQRGSAILGVNVGANKNSTDRVSDYVSGIRAFVGIADYFTINVSSPNTPGLRDLQKPELLEELLARILDARDVKAEAFGRKPVLLKIAPDLTLEQLDELVRVARVRKIDGMIVSNTTTSRPPSVTRARHAGEVGGLSGRPLFDLSTRMLAQAFRRVERQFPLIGVGGIDCGAAAWAKIEAGATLLQIYSGLVFQGPGLVNAIKRALIEKVGSGASLADRVGSGAALWAGAE